MKWFMFCVAMNFIAAIVLIGAGATELNNLGTSVPDAIAAKALKQAAACFHKAN